MRNSTVSNTLACSSLYTDGSKCANYGGKQVNVVAVSPADRFKRLNDLFLEDISMKPMGVGKFVQACSFLSLTLSVDNQIIHRKLISNAI